MNGPDRYKTLRGHSSAGDDGNELGSLEGLDPVTGLPVLIYEFEGEPQAQADDLDSDNIPRILWSGSVQGRGRLVAALTPGWQRLAEDSQALTPALLLDAARALRDAARIGLAHGDLRPERLLMVGDSLLLEGFGVPWRPGVGRYRAPEVEGAGTTAGDVWSLARIVEQIGLTVDDETVSAVLEQCSAYDSSERPSAEELYLALESLTSPQVSVERDGGESSDDAWDHAKGPARLATAQTVAGPESEAPAEGRSRRSDGVSAEDPRDTARPGPSASPAEAVSRATTEAQPAVPVEKVRSRSADSAVPQEEPAEQRRRLILLGALMAAVVILALLAIYGPRGGDPPVAATLEDTVYVVEVQVSPDDLPPVTIHLISSPEGSSLGRGESLGTAPRHLALDREGTWAFQGSVQGRRSEVVEIEVPDERTVTFVVPP